MRSALARHGMIPASRGGKLKCLSQNIAVTLYLLPLPVLLASLRLPVLLVAVVATVLTGLDYARQGARLHAARPPVPADDRPSSAQAARPGPAPRARPVRAWPDGPRTSTSAYAAALDAVLRRGAPHATGRAAPS